MTENEYAWKKPAIIAVVSVAASRAAVRSASIRALYRRHEPPGRPAGRFVSSSSTVEKEAVSAA
jgi:hypothetical protein